MSPLTFKYLHQHGIKAYVTL